MRRKYITACAVIFLLGVLFSLQGHTQVHKVKKTPRLTRQALLFVQGALRLRSVRSEMDVGFVLRNNDSSGEAVRSATITVNGVKIPETREPGYYEGIVDVNVRSGSGCPVNIKISTRDRREFTSSGNIDSLLKLHVSNIFPNQKDKIDVGEKPVTIRWEFIPHSRQSVNLTILNLNTNSVIFQKTGIRHTNQIVVPVGTIPRRQRIEIYVETPEILLPFNQKVHSDSFIKLFTKTSKKLSTHG